MAKTGIDFKDYTESLDIATDNKFKIRDPADEIGQGIKNELISVKNTTYINDDNFIVISGDSSGTNIATGSYFFEDESKSISDIETYLSTKTIRFATSSVNITSTLVLQGESNTYSVYDIITDALDIKNNLIYSNLLYTITFQAKLITVEKIGSEYTITDDNYEYSPERNTIIWVVNRAREYPLSSSEFDSNNQKTVTINLASLSISSDNIFSELPDIEGNPGRIRFSHKIELSDDNGETKGISSQDNIEKIAKAVFNLRSKIKKQQMVYVSDTTNMDLADFEAYNILRKYDIYENAGQKYYGKYNMIDFYEIPYWGTSTNRSEMYLPDGPQIHLPEGVYLDNSKEFHFSDNEVANYNVIYLTKNLLVDTSKAKQINGIGLKVSISAVSYDLSRSFIPGDVAQTLECIPMAMFRGIAYPLKCIKENVINYVYAENTETNQKTARFDTIFSIFKDKLSEEMYMSDGIALVFISPYRTDNYMSAEITDIALAMSYKQKEIKFKLEDIDGGDEISFRNLII